MTTSSKTVETIQGTVARISSKGNGIQLVGNPEWLNISAYHPIATMPTSGQLVEVQLERTDRGPWINSLRILDDASTQASSPNRDRAIARMSALRSAAIFLGHAATVHEEVKSDHVVLLAAKWLRWLEEEEKGGQSA